MVQPEIEELIEQARLAIEQKKYQLARNYVEDVLKVAPEHQGAYELQVLIKERVTLEEFNEYLRSAEKFIQENQFETAQKALDKALKIFPPHPVALKRMEAVNDSLRKHQIERLVRKI